VKTGLSGFPSPKVSVADDIGPVMKPTPYAFRSFDRQWIIPDARLINQPNPEIWSAHSSSQVYLTILERTSPSSGPGLTVTGLIPDLDHYNGRGGRVFPLWLDEKGTVPNVPPGLLAMLTELFGVPVTPEDMVAYIASLTAHPGFTDKFKSDLGTPGLRVPLTSDSSLFRDAIELGRVVIWLHSFGERYTDDKAKRPPALPRVPGGKGPSIPSKGAISHLPGKMPESIEFDPVKNRLYVGEGFIDGVLPQVWNYEVSGKQILRQWFSSRKANREKPVIGDKRPPSPLGDIQPDHWLPEYTTELLNVLHVISLLVELEAKQGSLLTRICSGPTITTEQLKASGALDLAESYPRSPTKVPKEGSTPLLIAELS
jgi:hypothetical protein